MQHLLVVNILLEIYQILNVKIAVELVNNQLQNVPNVIQSI